MHHHRTIRKIRFRAPRCLQPLLFSFGLYASSSLFADAASVPPRPDTVRADSAVSSAIRPTIDSSSWGSTMIIYGRRKPAFDMIALADEQRKTGATDDVNKILLLQKGVQSVPEAGSTLLIHGGGLYDNVYFVNGIRMMAPSHFPGHSFADRSGMFISALKNVSLITNTAGRYRDAGSVVSFRPGIVRLYEDEFSARPELVVLAGSLDFGATFTSPFKDTAGGIQIAGRYSDDNLMDWKNMAFGNGNTPMSPFVWSDSAALGYSLPRSFGDVTLTAEHNGKRRNTQAFGWFSFDSYGASRYRSEAFVPWGVASVTSESSDGRGIYFSAGGSRQHDYSGKKLGYVTPLKHLLFDNATLSAGRAVFSTDRLTIITGLRCDAVGWSGELTSHWTKVDGATVDSTYLLKRSGREAMAESQSTIRYSFPRGDVTANILLGASLSRHPGPFADPGVTVTINGAGSAMRAYAGVYTSRPDSRGLPDATYRGSQIKTYAASAEFSKKIGPRLSGSAQGYAKWTRRCPAFSSSPALPIWDPGNETKLLVRGCAFAADFDIAKNAFSLRIVQDINKAERIAGGVPFPYEWEIPWSTSAICKYSVSRNTSIYLKGMFAAGLPYRAPVVKGDEYVFGDAVHRCPTYRRVDFKFENIVPLRHNRHFRQRVVYVDIVNLLNAFEGLFGPSRWYWENAREYYWDAALRQHPIILEYTAISFGLRLGFGL